MEKNEWRDVFNHQPTYYLFLDLTYPMALDTLDKICVVLKNVTALSISLKGSLRFCVLGVYSISGNCKCVFPLQSLKYSYTKLQLSLESMKSTQAAFPNTVTFDAEKLSECLQLAVEQYEKYYQSTLPNKEEWPQLEIVFFSAQPTQKFSKCVQDALTSLHLGYIRKVQVAIVKSGWNGSSSGSGTDEATSPASQPVFGEEADLVGSLLQLTEMEGNAFQLESVFKGWLLDCANDSDHLRLAVGPATLRCDLRECILAAEALPATGHFRLATDAPPAPGAAGPSRGQQAQPRGKVPLYELDATALVRRKGLCGSLLFGQPCVAVPTKCWKLEWEELERNQQFFCATVRHLLEEDLVLLAERRGPRSAEVAPLRALFALFPSADRLLVKSVAPAELLLPRCDPAAPLPVPEAVEREAKECLQGLERKQSYNPLAVTSGLYDCLSASLIRAPTRPVARFMAPLADGEKQRRKKKAAVAEVPHLDRPASSGSQGAHFVTASAMLKNKFPTQLQ